jgi:tetratricopeptide (TPR) repeat protein
MANRLPGRERTMVQMRWARYAGVPQAVTLIREATRKYPDAADAWYELGEAFFHDAVVMGSPEEAEEAFRKAADLQPTVAPYRVHLLDLAFEWHADSTHIARELESYAQLAPDDARTRAGRVAFALVFGDTAARARARSELHRLDPESATQIYVFLSHSRFAEVREAIFPVIKSRADQRFRIVLQHEQLMNLSTIDGRVRDVLAILEDSTTDVGFRYCGPMYMALRGLPVPESILEQRFASSRKDSSSFPGRNTVMCAVWYATRYGDWRWHQLLLTRARETASRELAAGNAANARAWDWTARVAEAHGLWRQGRKEDALQAFESTLPGDLGGWETLWYVGQLNLELGRLDQAERAFRALWKDRDVAPAALQRARILERMGRLDEAREAYQFFTHAWRRADPELQPLVTEARQAVARLSRARD